LCIEDGGFGELGSELCGQIIDLCGQPTNSKNLAVEKIEYFRNSFYKIVARPVPDQCQIFWRKTSGTIYEATQYVEYSFSCGINSWKTLD
jgi:hypothetical protein